MKKSQLRKIIRESIKELITEQSSINAWFCASHVCPPGQAGGPEALIFPSGVTPQVGMHFKTPSNFSPSHLANKEMTITGGHAQWGISQSWTFNHPTQGPMALSIDQHPAMGGSSPGTGNQGSGLTPVTIISGCGGSTPPTSGCDNTMAGSCAQTWLPSNMNWPNMVNFACTGSQTYSAVEQSQLMGATNLLNSNGFTGTIPSFSNYQDISNFVNSTGIGQPQKGQIKRKLAKSHWGGCMFTDCNC